MGGSSGGGGQTTVQKSDPWGGQQPYLTYGFEQAQDQYKSATPEYYQGSTVAPLSATTNQAMQLQAQRALSGNPLANASQQQLVNTANGNYLYGNPYLDANFNAGADAITKAYNGAVQGQTSAFAGGNRTGSGMQQYYQDQQNDTLAKNLNNLYGQTYFQNYNNERTNQMNAAQMAPSYANMDYTNLDALSSVGGAQDTYNQNVLNADIDKWNYNQNLPANKLAQYMGLVQGNYGADSTSTSTPKSSGSNTMGNLLSAGMMAASIFSDRRLKTNVTLVGKTDTGLNVYEYEYIGSPERYVGVMADEVEAVIPEAVETHPTGYKMVNYRMVA